MTVEDEIGDSLHKNTEQIKTLEELNCWDEEARDRVIIHTDWAIIMEQHKSLFFQIIAIPWYCCSGTSMDLCKVV